MTSLRKPKTFTCQICGKEFTRHDEGYRHWVECSTKRDEEKKEGA